MMSACGVLCSECPAFKGRTRGPRYRAHAAEAWRSIYGLDENPENMTCGGCTSPDDRIFHTSIKCKARRCCIGNGFATCAECPTESCSDLERAQSVWDGVPELASTLSPRDFATYALPYCGHRDRLAAAGAAFRRRER